MVPPLISWVVIGKVLDVFPVCISVTMLFRDIGATEHLCPFRRMHTHLKEISYCDWQVSKCNVNRDIAIVVHPFAPVTVEIIHVHGHINNLIRVCSQRDFHHVAIRAHSFHIETKSMWVSEYDSHVPILS